MPKLPQVSSKETIKALRKMGFKLIHQRGSHVKLTNDKKQTVIVPLQKILKKGTLKNGILKPINLSVEEFVKLLKN